MIKFHKYEDNKNPMMPIYWKRNSRIKNLVPADRLIDGRTPVNNFPAEAATVIMTGLSSPKPSFTIHIRGKATRYSNSQVVSRNPIPNYECCSVMRIHCGHSGRATPNPIILNGEIASESFAEMNEVVNEVKKLIYSK
jgi:hypothetical protein